MRVIKAFILSIIPFLLLVGFFRLARGLTFLPSSNELISILSSAPDMAKVYSENMNFISRGFENMNNAFGLVHDMGSFFWAIGEFFNAIGVLFSSIGRIIITPIQFIGWAMGFILGF